MAIKNEQIIDEEQLGQISDKDNLMKKGFAKVANTAALMELNNAITKMVNPSNPKAISNQNLDINATLERFPVNKLPLPEGELITSGPMAGKRTTGPAPKPLNIPESDLSMPTDNTWYAGPEHRVAEDNVTNVGNKISDLAKSGWDLQVDIAKRPYELGQDIAESVMDWWKGDELPMGEDLVEFNNKKARNIRTDSNTGEVISMLDADGNTATHKMAHVEINGKEIVFPTIFPSDDGWIKYNVKNEDESWNAEELNKAYEHARDNDELFKFDSFDEAHTFAQGSWKQEDYGITPRTFEGDELEESFEMDTKIQGF
tara:strand:- start:196 stop:1140 length:945 start_codon:yes stop_codon:yes gene_type:complete